MTQILAWLLVYSAVLAALGALTAPWRERWWYKVLFLPGALFLVVTQSVAAFVSVGKVRKVSLFADKKPLIKLDRSRVPWLAGAVYILVAHVLLYLLFLFSLAGLESYGLVDLGFVCLPPLGETHALDLPFGRVCTEAYRWLALPENHPIVVGSLVYVGVSIFAFSGLKAIEWLWMSLVLGTATLVFYVVDFFGVGIRFMSTGWWGCALGHFEDWWARFSLFIILAMMAFTVFAMVRLVQLVSVSMWENNSARR